MIILQIPVFVAIHIFAAKLYCCLHAGTYYSGGSRIFKRGVRAKRAAKFGPAHILYINGARARPSHEQNRTRTSELYSPLHDIALTVTDGKAGSSISISLSSIIIYDVIYFIVVIGPLLAIIIQLF